MLIKKGGAKMNKTALIQEVSEQFDKKKKKRYG